MEEKFSVWSKPRPYKNRKTVKKNLSEMAETKNEILLGCVHPDFPRSGDLTPKFKMVYIFIELSYCVLAYMF